MQWLEQLQDLVLLELTLVAALVEPELDPLPELELQPPAQHDLVEALPAGQSQRWLGLHQPAALAMDQHPPLERLAQHSLHELEEHFANSTYSSPILRISLEWLIISQLSVLQGAQRASQAQYRSPSVDYLDNQTSFLLQ